MSYSDQEKAQCVVWFIEEAYGFVEFQRRFRREKNNRNAKMPTMVTVKRWLNSFLELGTIQNQAGKVQLKLVLILKVQLLF